MRAFGALLKCGQCARASGRSLPMRPLGPTTKGSERAFQFLSASGASCALGLRVRPVLAVVAGDVGSVGAYGDPGFSGGVVGYGAAVAVGWGLAMRSNVDRRRWCKPLFHDDSFWFRVIAADSYAVVSKRGLCRHRESRRYWFGSLEAQRRRFQQRPPLPEALASLLSSSRHFQVRFDRREPICC